MCCCRAYGMICVLEVLGVGTYMQDFVNEHPEGNNRRHFVTQCSGCPYYIEIAGYESPFDGWNEWWVKCPACNDKRVRGCWGGGIWNKWQGVCKKGAGQICYSPAGPRVHIGTYETIDNSVSYPDTTHTDDEDHCFGYYAWWNSGAKTEGGTETVSYLDGDASATDTVLSVPCPPFFVDDKIVVQDSAHSEYATITAVGTNDITIAAGLANAYTTANGALIRKGHLQEPDDESSW